MLRLLLIFALLCPLTGWAETIEIPLGQQGAANIRLPARGESQQAVLLRFGLADQEHAPVGQPPITRWDYREFSLYFESGRVIDRVIHHHPRYPAQLPDAQQQPKESP
ncbi:phosphodiesterase [Pseudomonas cavernae]|uniref:Phosphodiesterase n=1 Tax=Pseudomonas cavernae TaxID=2320867 RepID=A0A385Z5S9_9PSED|nr:phosphodiesterase [Pseudomonas cavernae]AYC33427.1 phosphodiesterase [Pseudomonas cavernae]